MNPHAIHFEVADVRGRQHALRAVKVEGSGWLLEVSVDGRVFTHRCGDWKAVELTIRRLRARLMDRRPAAASSEAGATRALVAGLLLVVSLLATPAGFAQARPSEDGVVRAAEDLSDGWT